MGNEIFEAIELACEIMRKSIETEEHYDIDDIILSDSGNGFSIGVYKSNCNRNYNSLTDKYDYHEVDRFFFNYDEGLGMDLFEQVRCKAESWVRTRK